MGENEKDQLTALSESLPTKTLHQYKTFNTQYIQWLTKSDKNITTTTYDSLPLSSILIHRFLLDTIITKTKYSNKLLPLLTSYINSFIFLQKICIIHGNKQIDIDSNYLDSILNIHQHWFDLNDEVLNLPTLSIISFNAWNPFTPHLKKTHFKSTLEKLKFLVDFHLMTYLGANYSDRSMLKIHDLKCNDINKYQLVIDNNTNNLTSSKLKPQRHLLPQNSPMLCPFTSLATYLFFKFYGVIDSSKGDGFPNLFNEELISSMTIINGRLLSNYPKDSTLNSAYISMFKYCNQPYKRKNYFDTIAFPYPDFTQEQIDLMNKESSFIDGIPFDITAVFNMRSPYQPYNSFNVNDFFKERGQVKPPESIVFQFFQEIEFYKQRKNYNKLTIVSRNLLKTLEMIRLIFVANLPIIHKTFPDHDLFKHSIFENTDIISFLNDSIFQTNNISNKFLPLVNLNNVDDEQLMKQLIEMAPSNIVSQQSPTALASTTMPIPSVSISDDVLDEFRKQNFQFVQFQTLSNFKTLISFLTKIFDNMTIKRSSKETISKQLTLLNDSIIERINNSTPKDIKDYFLKKELIRHKSEQLIQYDDENNNNNNKNDDNVDGGNDTSMMLPLRRLLSDSDESGASSFDEEEPLSDTESMQEELKSMVEEFVTSKVDRIISQHLSNFENKLDYIVDSLVDEKIDKKLQKIDFTKYIPKRKISDLEMNESLDDIQPLKVHHTNPYKKIIQESKFTIKNTDSILTSNDSHSTPKRTTLTPEQQRQFFSMNENITDIDDVILEWFTPNPNMGNQCVHSMNKTHDKSWRTEFESLYKQRKQIVEFYVYLINTVKYDRYKAIDVCNEIMEKNHLSIKELSKFLKSWKKNHLSSFDGII